jgi:ribosome-binding factor A
MQLLNAINESKMQEDELDHGPLETIERFELSRDLHSAIVAYKENKTDLNRDSWDAVKEFEESKEQLDRKLDEADSESWGPSMLGMVGTVAVVGLIVALDVKSDY